MSKISSLLKKGSFYPVSIETKLLGKDIDQISEQDMQNWNSVKLNLTFNLSKLPGKEVSEKK